MINFTSVRIPFLSNWCLKFSIVKVDNSILRLDYVASLRKKGNSEYISQKDR